MYIKNDRGSAEGLRVPGMHEDDREDGIDIPESGVRRVKEQTGEALIEHCPTIHEHEPDDD